MGWVIGIGVLGIGGFIAYKLISGSSNPLSNIVGTVETTVSGGASTIESILNKDPISVTSVGKDIYHGAKDAYNELTGWL